MRELGLSHVPEDRHAEGLVLQFQAFESVILGYEKNPSFGTGFLLNQNKFKRIALSCRVPLMFDRKIQH